MNRRGFLAAMLAGAVMDPERLLWEPGRKLISIPRPVISTGWATPAFFNLGDVITFGQDPTRYVVTAVGGSFGDIRFRIHDSDALNALLPTENLYHSRLEDVLRTGLVRPRF